MLDGIPLVDAHIHAARLPTLKASWKDWVAQHGRLVPELERQLGFGAVALKLHPVHGGFPPNDRTLYTVYAYCEGHRVPVIFHVGTSVFPGSTNRYADPALVEDVLRDFPDLTVVLAHGGRGWWYEAAAFLALMRPQVL